MNQVVETTFERGVFGGKVRISYQLSTRSTEDSVEEVSEMMDIVCS